MSGYSRPVFAFNSPYGLNAPYDPDEANEEFMDKQNQRVFVRKVFSLLTLQVLCLVGLVSLLIYPEEIRSWAILNHFLFIGFLIGFILLIIVLLCCCGGFPRAFPGNILSLILFTIVEGLLLGSLAAVYEWIEVLLTVCVLSYLCLTLVIFSFQTRLDYTTISAGFYVAFFTIFPAILLLFYYPVSTVIISGLMALTVCLNFAFHTHRMMSCGNLNPNEWIFAALNVHLDIFTCRCFVARSEIGN